MYEGSTEQQELLLFDSLWLLVIVYLRQYKYLFILLVICTGQTDKFLERQKNSGRTVSAGRADSLFSFIRSLYQLALIEFVDTMPDVGL